MPKLKGPLLSLDAHGTLGRQLTFQGFPAGTRVISRPDHPDVRSPAQLLQRGFFLEAVGLWNALSAVNKAAYNSEASGLNLTGYNLFLQEFLSTHLGWGIRIFMPLQEGAGTTSLDASGYDNHATLLGPSWTVLPSGAAALYFDGINDYGLIAADPSLEITDAITMAVTVFREEADPSATGFLWKSEINVTPPSYGIFIGGGGSLELLLNGVATFARALPPLNAWQTLVLTYDRSNMIFYRHGSVEVTAAHAAAITPESGSPLLLGILKKPTWSWKGIIIGLRLLSRAWSPSEVSAYHRQMMVLVT